MLPFFFLTCTTISFISSFHYRNEFIFQEHVSRRLNIRNITILELEFAKILGPLTGSKRKYGWKTLFYFPSEDKFLYYKRAKNWHGGKETYMKGRERQNVFCFLVVSPPPGSRKF